MHDGVAACAGIVRRGDPDRFLAVMAAPARIRGRLFPLYAFNVEVARAPWAAPQEGIAEIRLQWWRDALEEIGAGRAARRHEVAAPLSRLLDADSARLLGEIAAARRWDVRMEPFADADQLRDYLSKTSGNLLVAAGAALGGAPEAVLRPAGLAQGVANWLRAAPALRRSGRFPLVDDSPAGVRALAEEGLDHLSAARARRGDVPGRARPALLSLWRTRSALQAARRDPQSALGEGLPERPLRDRLGLAWRAAVGSW